MDRVPGDHGALRAKPEETCVRAGTADATVHTDQRSKSSPDPMSATDRYRLVTPYRLRL